MKSLLITNAVIQKADGEGEENGDVLIENGKISRAGGSIQFKADQVIHADGAHLCPGFIDAHTHCYPEVPLGVQPDQLGIEAWTTSIIDAGCSGANNFEDFKDQYIIPAKTKVYALLNVSAEGLKYPHELNDLGKIDEEKFLDCVEKNRNYIVGAKARASATVVENMGIAPIKKAADLAHKAGIPLMVHIGNYPPELRDVLNCLEKGDVVTHTYHGKPGGLIRDGKVIEEAVEARKRGVLFDIGHGSASFNFKTYMEGVKLGFDCDMISSDRHAHNYPEKIRSLVDIVNKIINCGMPVSKAIDKVTRVPAQVFSLSKYGQIKPGYAGDLMLFEIVPVSETVRDADGNELTLTKKIKPLQLVVSRGEEIDVIK